jgi:hypothetical protein
MQLASAIAEAHKERVSDIVVLNASRHPDTPLGIRAHFISSDWSLLLAMATLPQVLRNIRIELIEESAPAGTPLSTDSSSQSSVEGELK